MQAAAAVVMVDGQTEVVLRAVDQGAHSAPYADPTTREQIQRTVPAALRWSRAVTERAAQHTR